MKLFSLKFRIFFALLSFATGSLTTNMIEPGKRNYKVKPASVVELPKPTQYRLVDETPESPILSPPLNIPSTPGIGSGFGGGPITVYGTRREFLFYTGPQASFSGTINFASSWKNRPLCGIGMDKPMTIQIEYKQNKAGLTDRLILRAEGSHFEPNTQIHIICEEQ